MKMIFWYLLLILLVLLCGCSLEPVSDPEPQPEPEPEVEFRIGDRGPAGGFIFYDCDKDNSTGNADGLISTECGWRYLEAAPEDIVVDTASEFVFGYYRTTPDGNSLYINGTTDYDASDCTATAVGKGKANTAMLASRMALSAYQSESGASKDPDYASRLCLDYVHEGFEDWFLPSEEELDLMFRNLKANGSGDFEDELYWSSSESPEDASYAWSQDFETGSQIPGIRSDSFHIRPARAFLSAGQECSTDTYMAETIEPTCTESGYQVYRYVDTDNVADKVLTSPALGHSLGLDGWHCGSCGHLMTEQCLIGPAGGYVFYDCDEDNASGNADGLVSTECGWRYLEAAPADIVVDSVPEFVFGYYRTSQEGGNLFVNGTAVYNASDCTGTAVGTGKNNTMKLVAAMEDCAYISESGADTTSDYAAKLCDDYTCGSYGDWFLPSRDELKLMFKNLKAYSLGGFTESYYWTSSENDSNVNDARDVIFSGGYNGEVPRSSTDRVRAVRAFMSSN